MKEEKGGSCRCAVCGSGDVVLFRTGVAGTQLEPRDLCITDSRYGIVFPIWRCRHCSYCFAFPVEQKVLNSCYQDMVDTAYDDGVEYRELQQQRMLDKYLDYSDARPGHLLDVGCGTGLMLAAAKKRGISATGVEPSRWAVSQAQSKGLDARLGSVPGVVLDQVYDLITLIDIIEHVTDPTAVLKEIKQRLAPSGTALVVTPDVGSIAAWMMQGRWWHYRLAHVGYFNRRSFGELAKRCGFKVVCSRRAVWYFEIAYLLERLEVYLPISFLRKLGEQSRLGRKLLAGILPVNLFDSWTFYLQHDG